MLTEEQSERVFESKAFEKLTDRELVLFQLSQERLCVPFSIYHQKTEKVLGRPVYTHEFVLPTYLIMEVLGIRTRDENSMDALQGNVIVKIDIH